MGSGYNHKKTRLSKSFRQRARGVRTYYISQLPLKAKEISNVEVGRSKGSSMGMECKKNVWYITGLFKPAEQCLGKRFNLWTETQMNGPPNFSVLRNHACIPVAQRENFCGTINDLLCCGYVL